MNINHKTSSSLLVAIFAVALALLSCNITRNVTPTPQPTGAYMTPANLQATPGNPLMPVPPANDWNTYNSPQLGISVRYPPDWQMIELTNTVGFYLYPPDSDPDLPSPAISFRWVAQPYAAGTPLIQTGSPLQPVELGGLSGQQYQDSQYAVPTQSIYIELPFNGGILLISATQGPNVDLTPQLNEILSTMTINR